MEGDERYSYEFDMPASENVYVKVHATELDFWTSDDQFASPLHTYYARDNWGVRPEHYGTDILAERSCNDAFCSDCQDSSVWAQWRITKVE
jgi:hypothetical protein